MNQIPGIINGIDDPIPVPVFGFIFRSAFKEKFHARQKRLRPGSDCA